MKLTEQQASIVRRANLGPLLPARYTPLYRPAINDPRLQGWRYVAQGQQETTPRRPDLPYQFKYPFAVIEFDEPLSASEVQRLELRPCGSETF